jgi:hypothetical protein
MGIIIDDNKFPDNNFSSAQSSSLLPVKGGAMALKFRQSLAIISSDLSFIWQLIVACAACLFVVWIFIRLTTNTDFWFVPSIPVPSYATNVTNSDMPYGQGSLGGYRIVQFETDQPVSQIQQFYRVQLQQRGWYFVCAPTRLAQPDCPLGLSPSVELAEAYSRNDEPTKVRAIDVEIYKPGENLTGSNNRLVEIIEYRYPKENP